MLVHDKPECMLEKCVGQLGGGIVEMIVGRVSMSSEDVYQSTGRYKAKIDVLRPRRLRQHVVLHKACN